MRRTHVYLAVVALLAIALLVWWRSADPAPVAAAAKVAPQVEVSPVQRVDLPLYVAGVGRVEPLNGVEVKSRIDGQIERLLFVEGANVAAGQPLFQLDPRPYRAAIAEAQAGLAEDEARLAVARNELKRVSALIRSGFTTQQALEQRQAVVGQLQAAAQGRRATLDNARLTQSFTTIRAPFAGRTGRRLANVGDFLRAADGKPLVQLVQLQPISVVLTVPQDVLPQLVNGQRTPRLQVEALSVKDQRLLAQGELRLVGSEVERQTGTIELKAVFDNSGHALWPGQLVNGRIRIQVRSGAIVVPAAAVQTGPSGRFVYVIDRKRSVAMRPVAVGPPAGDFAVVEKGLAVGEMVVLNKHDQLAPGMTVKASLKQVAPAGLPAAAAKQAP